MPQLTTRDLAVFLFYFIIVSAYGYWIYHRKKKAESGPKDFFLAEGTLTWWAIGASLIASNISAEQFIGMSGSGFKMGLAIATYEWMAAATLLIVGVFFMPIYLKNHIYTMPQFLTRRYSESVSMVMAIFWLLLYVVVNLTSILYLGALAVSTISGYNFTLCMIFLAIFSIIITLGGMKVIGYTDVVQVFFLVLGGLATTYLAIHLVSDHFQTKGLANGFNVMMKQASDHFDMVYEKGNPNYMDLPGFTVLVGGMWIVNLNYWGCNQYITQRALGADLKTARNGILFAAFLKLLMPVIVVLPGIAAYVLHQQGLFQTEMMQAGELNPDRAYPVLLNLLPSGLKGLAFAALTAAIVASLAGKANSIATIYTLDIHKKYINREASDVNLVNVGRITVLVAMVLAIAISPFLGIDKKGGFQYIQEYTGFISPGVFCIFLLGFFWKRATARAAMIAIIAGFLLSVIFKFGFENMPFLDRMGWVFLICVALMVVVSLADPRSRAQEDKLDIERSMFKTHPAFTIGVIIITGILAALYLVFEQQG
ncbi:MAG TPA: sodium/sugar symporter [Chitinophagaceae bacterium]|nr:sodium/sugar symporter [Chitinophagaceae bacterium]